MMKIHFLVYFFYYVTMFRSITSPVGVAAGVLSVLFLYCSSYREIGLYQLTRLAGLRDKEDNPIDT